MSRIGVMVCGHGSRDAQAIGEFESVAAGIRERLPQYDVESGFLEFATPVIREGLDKLRGRGADLCLAVPGMLFAAGHAKNDIPSVLNTYEAEHPGMDIRYARELGIDEKLLRAAGDRVAAALDAAGRGVPLHETMLVVVGRGASDPDANSNVAKVMRLLWEGFGFGWGETAYSGVTFPLVEPAPRARRASRLPAHRRLPVLPLHRRARQADLRAHRPGGRRATRTSSSSRPRTSTTIPRCSTRSRSGSRRPCAART